MAGPEQVGGMPLHVEAAILDFVRAMRGSVRSYWAAQGERRKAPSDRAAM